MDRQNKSFYAINLYSMIDQSNKRMLSRTYAYCRNEHSDINSIINCMFNKIGNNSKQNNCNLKYIKYYNPDNAELTDGVSTWQGMCEYKNNQIIICGTTDPSPTTGSGLIYFGNISCNDNNQSSVIFSVPDSEYTSCYGPRYNFTTQEFTLVGSYNNPSDSNTYGFLFRGTLPNLNNPDNYITKMQNPTYNYPMTFVHSTDGNFAVGASGNFVNNNQQANLKAWIYDITQKSYTPYQFNNSIYTTIYGIILNPDDSYTIVGGYSNGINTQFVSGFIADMIYNTTTYTLSFKNETSLTLDKNNNVITHFEGISRTNDPNIYTLAGDGLSATNLTIGSAFIIKRNTIDKRFDIIKSTSVDYACSANTNGVTSSNSVLGNTIVGYFVAPSITSSFQCIIDWNKVNN